MIKTLQWHFISLRIKFNFFFTISNEIKRCLLLERKVMTNLDSILKSREMTLPTKVHLVSSVQFSSVAQLCLTLCDPMDCSLSSSSIHGIFQARVLEWVAISFSRDIPTQGSNPGLLHYRQTLLPSEPQGKPTKMYTCINWQYFVIYETSKSLRI